jgi:hypothetical protein
MPMATDFGKCRLGDKTAKHRNFGKIGVWPEQSCHTSQAVAGRDQVKAFIRNRGLKTPAKTGNLETITVMADQCLA